MYRVAYMYVPPPPPRRTLSCLVPPLGVNELTHKMPLKAATGIAGRIATGIATEGNSSSTQVVCIVGILLSVQVTCIVVSC